MSSGLAASVAAGWSGSGLSLGSTRATDGRTSAATHSSHCGSHAVLGDPGSVGCGLAMPASKALARMIDADDMVDIRMLGAKAMITSSDADRWQPFNQLGAARARMAGNSKSAAPIPTHMSATLNTGQWWTWMKSTT